MAQNGTTSTEQNVAADNAPSGGLANPEPSPTAPRPLPAAEQPRPTLVPLAPAPAVTGPLSATPAPKRFSAINVNKKFLEKTSSSSSVPTSSLSAQKSAGSISRPPSQSSASHSRLVTTKLTAASQSSSTAQGWSRPSSVTPPVANGVHPPSGSGPQTGLTSGPAHYPPQLPHAGKVILPQPRHSLSSKEHFMGGTKKSAWGNMTSNMARMLDSSTDFPTAAEVAQVASHRHAKQAAAGLQVAFESQVANKQREEEADTFRGLHLDPNAHHWDEMEEDDDNFLDGVIEFGDGRQYKIESAGLPEELEAVNAVQSPTSPLSRPESLANEAPPLSSSVPSNISVSKEDRFADDFDRSWPRSRESNGIVRDSSSQAASITSTPPIPDPESSSRVLFNERSNKLEPYTMLANNRGGKRSSLQADASSPVDTRPRDAQTGNIQLLTKQAADGSSSRSRRGTTGVDRPRDRERPSARSSSPTKGREPPQPIGAKDKRPSMEARGRPMSNMGPPPVPPHALGQTAKESRRQLPPHLSDLGRPTSQEWKPRSQEQTVLSAASTKPTSWASLLAKPDSAKDAQETRDTPETPEAPAAPVVQSPTVDFEEAHKDVMQTAAARAKERRLQEEMEREKEKERAKRKAAELEARMKAADAPTLEVEDAATAFIQSAIDSTKTRPSEVTPVVPSETTTGSEASARKPPSLKDMPPLHEAPPHPSLGRRRTSTSSTLPSAPPVSTPADKSDSWRTKASPRISSATIKHAPSVPKPTLPSFDKPPPSALEQVEAFAEELGDDLEVVDFSDMAKFLGVSDEVDKSVVKSPVEVAAPKTPAESEPATVSSPNHRRSQSSGNQDISPWRKADAAEKAKYGADPIDGSKVVRDDSLTIVGQQPPPRLHAYKEAAMTSLDDAMSRIKGALDGMHEEHQHVQKQAPRSTNDDQPVSDPTTVVHRPPVGEAPSTLAVPPNPAKERWVPSFRARNVESETREPLVTVGDRPPSPKPAWNVYNTRIPRLSIPRDPIHPKQLHLATKPSFQIRWDILGFEPPVEGMSKRTFSVNEVLFRRNIGYKGKHRYRVQLPPKPSSLLSPSRSPKTLLTPKPLGLGAFGRPPGADGLATWRKATPTPKVDLDDPLMDELNTTSRSPPPGFTRGDNVQSPLVSAVKADPARLKSQPKVPEGSAVGFYKDSPVAPKAVPNGVSFVVNSELDALHRPEESKLTTELTGLEPPAVSRVFPPSTSSELKTSPISPDFALPGLVQGNKAESKSSDESADRVPITPPVHHTSPWARTSLSLSVKDTPSRAPDPEHLKAVWSQTSDKPGVPSVNSLEGIADDLTSLPFTIQDVKSEDGETPPPTAPSRMSLHDVTRAFQQVPPTAPGQRQDHSANTSPSISRPPNQPSYVLPPAPVTNARPSYIPYTPPVSQTNSYYGHTVSAGQPRMPVNGHNTVYNQNHLWMPPSNSPAPGAGMMRQMTPGYPAPQSYGSPMLYAGPGGQPVYPSPPMSTLPPAAQPQQPVQPQAHHPPHPSMPMMSPALAHTHAAPHSGMPMYSASPVMMHNVPPPMHQPAGSTYIPMQNGRGPGGRPDTGHAPQAFPPAPGYPSMNSNSFRW